MAGIFDRRLRNASAWLLAFVVCAGCNEAPMDGRYRAQVCQPVFKSFANHDFETPQFDSGYRSDEDEPLHDWVERSEDDCHTMRLKTTTNKNGVIAIEITGYGDISNLMSRFFADANAYPLSRSVLDGAWGEMVSQTEYRCENGFVCRRIESQVVEVGDRGAVRLEYIIAFGADTRDGEGKNVGSSSRSAPGGSRSRNRNDDDDDDDGPVTPGRTSFPIYVEFAATPVDENSDLLACRVEAQYLAALTNITEYGPPDEGGGPN